MEDLQSLSRTPTEDLPEGPIRWWERSSDAIGVRGYSAGADFIFRTMVLIPSGTATNTTPTITLQLSGKMAKSDDGDNLRPGFRVFHKLTSRQDAKSSRLRRTRGNSAASSRIQITCDRSLRLSYCGTINDVPLSVEGKLDVSIWYFVPPRSHSGDGLCR